MFYADEDAWMALPEDERNAAIGRIGRWFGEHAAAGRIVEGKRLAGGKRATTTVRLGRIQRSGDAYHRDPAMPPHLPDLKTGGDQRKGDPP